MGAAVTGMDTVTQSPTWTSGALLRSSVVRPMPARPKPAEASCMEHELLALQPLAEGMFDLPQGCG